MPRLLVIRPENGPTYLVDLATLPAAVVALGAVGHEIARCGVVGHNLLFDLPLLTRHLRWPYPTRVWDTYTAEHLLVAGIEGNDGGPIGKGLAAAVQRRLGVSLNKAEQRSDWVRPELTHEQLGYAATDVLYLHALMREQGRALREFDLQSVADSDMETVRILHDMTLHGVAVDRAQANALLAKAEVELEAARERVRQVLPLEEGGILNPASPKQLMAALGRRLRRLPSSTDRKSLVLEVQPQDAEVAGVILAFRAFDSKRRFLRQLLRWIEADGRIHPVWGNCSESGRLTVANPNMQGLPRGEIRRCIVAPAGRVLVGADFSQIELRLAGWLYDEPLIKQAYERGEDLHRATAAQMAGVPYSDVDEAQRKHAKVINFGVLYGMGSKALSKTAAVDFGLVLSVLGAQRQLDRWWATHPEIRKTRDLLRVRCEGNRLREARTVGGRRRVLRPGDQRSVRLAINHKVQGTSADIIRLAMRLLADRLPPAAGLVLSVHDELVVECAEADGAAVAEMLARTMEEAANAIIPGMPCPVLPKVARDCAELK